jgi:hypothetical protein
VIKGGDGGTEPANCLATEMDSMKPSRETVADAGKAVLTLDLCVLQE